MAVLCIERYWVGCRLAVQLGRRVYVGSAEIPKVKSGRGLVLISTSKGAMTGTEAAKAKLGGELLKVY